MTRTIAILAAVMAFAPATYAGDSPGKDAPAAAGDTSADAPKDSTSKAIEEIEGGFSIPAADSDKKEPPKK